MESDKPKKKKRKKTGTKKYVFSNIKEKKLFLICREKNEVKLLLALTC